MTIGGCTHPAAPVCLVTGVPNEPALVMRRLGCDAANRLSRTACGPAGNLFEARTEERQA